MHGKTPIRVRGKRSAGSAEKWNHGKHRKRGRSLTISERSTSVTSNITSQADSPKRRKRARQDEPLSRLEQLPTEVLQHIFILSANIELPLASPVLSSQLSGRHLHVALTNQLLHPVLGGRDSSAAELIDATRLMNSRFFTTYFFHDWLEPAYKETMVHSHKSNSVAKPSASTVARSQADHQEWSRMEPHKDLLPPIKLLRPPYNSEKVALLGSLTVHQHAPSAADPVYCEMARNALEIAIKEGDISYLRCIFYLGVLPVTTDLRLAVVEGGCDAEIVEELIQMNRFDMTTNIDFLDPVLWAWAERAKAIGNERAKWLLEVLKHEARSGVADEA